MKVQMLVYHTPIIPLSESKRFIIECMEVAGASRENAEVFADNLTAADYKGHLSHGMQRLEIYVEKLMTGFPVGKVTPKILKEGPVTAWIDGMHGLGAVVGKFAMNVAIQKAKKMGVGVVAVKGSDHFGMAGIYAEQASKEGLIGLSFTNTFCNTVPTRAKNAGTGTNPLSLAAPAENGDSFFLDMAASVVAVGKLEMLVHKHQPVPEGWAYNENGEFETDPAKGMKTRKMVPLGGTELTSGYKGFGLSVLGDILCGILSGSTYGLNIRKWLDISKPADLGHCFIAIDPNCFAPGFESRLSDLNNSIRSMEPIDPAKPVLVPGDPERANMKRVDEAGGVRYLQSVLDSFDRLGKKLNVKPPQPLKQ